MSKPTLLSFGYAVLLAVLLTGCNAAKSYQQAQTAFSQGAEREMRDRYANAAVALPPNFVNFNQLYKGTAPADTTLSASAYYKNALAAVTKALKGAAQLEKLDALDNATALEALTHWRLQDYNTAKIVADKALPLLDDNPREENDQRDRAMMTALPGLINMDAAYQGLLSAKAQAAQLSADMDDTQKQAIYDGVKATYLRHISADTDGASSVVRGLDLIERAIAGVRDNPNMTVYLRCAQLAGVDTWGDMLEEVFKVARRMGANAEEVAWVSQERNRFEGIRTAYLAKLEGELRDGRQNKLYKYWQTLL